MAGELAGPDLYAGVAEAALQRALSALREAEAARDAAATSQAAATAALAQMQALAKAVGVTYLWSGPDRTVLSLLRPDGTYGPGADLQGDPGAVGDTPVIHVGSVVEGDFAVGCDLSDPKNPVLHFALERGYAAWTPVPARVLDGARCVLQIVDWIGGGGPKPATGLYIGAAGFVADTASASDFRGLSAGGTVTHTGTPTTGHIAVFGADGDHIGDGGALSAFGASLIAAASAVAVKGLLALAVGDVIGAAPLASAALSGLPTAPNPTAGDASTKIATTAFVSAAIAAVINSAPAALDTLGEIASQLANDESAVSALTNTVAGKLAKASNLSDLANAATARTNLGVAIGSNVQAWDADLDAIAALTTTAYGRALLTVASATALKAALSIAAGDVSGLGGAAQLNVGTVAGTVAAGNDPRLAAASAVSSQAAYLLCLSM